MKDETIFKYELPRHGIRTILIPKGGEVLGCKTQDNKINIWVLVNEKQNKIERHFEVLFTGDDAYETANVKRVFIDTVLLLQDSLVCHVFERVLK